MKIFKHCQRPISCWYMEYDQNDINTKPLKTIEMIKIFKNSRSINSNGRAVYFKEEE